MKGSEIRERFLRFFEERGHRRLPSASLVPDNDPTLLFTGAGMNQFKDMFLGKGTLPWKRVTTAQKCLRVPDLEKVGATPRHHTFFEMLGNFSFGDYFKGECIPWEWEFFTKVCGIPEENLVVTVFEEDEEAASVWREVVGLAPERIFRFKDDENFWPAEARSKGPNGPCGPCSEIYFDWTPGEPLPSSKGLRALPDGRFTEIGNCVFTQFERREGKPGEPGVLVPLPQKNIDVGLGLERIAAVLQGKKTNFETDLFEPLVRAIECMFYADFVPAEQVQTRKTRTYRIADHIRAVVFCIADGVIPGNEERNYVVRKILRRAIRDGYELKRDAGPVLHELVETVAAIMGDAYPEIRRHQSRIQGVILVEEERFREIYARGRNFLDEHMERARAAGKKAFPGTDAFELHDTFGFPSDLTQAIVEEQGFSYDEAGFEKAMQEQRERARRGSTLKGDIFAGGAIAELKGERVPTTAFVGYEADSVAGERVLALMRPTTAGDYATGSRVPRLAEGEEAGIVVGRTPFYSEGGGQVGDSGTIRSEGGAEFAVQVCRNFDGYATHVGRVAKGSLALGDRVDLRVDPDWRWRVTKNHTATHLLHKALKDVLGASVHQAGSLVHPDYLRFDFTWPQKLTDEQVRAIEDLVNRKVMEAIPVEWTVKSMDEAKGEGAVMLFGEKYGDRVRVLRVGEFSVELCGGTHVANTGNIGPFRITKEQALGAGVRRIFALTGPGAIAHLRGRDEGLEEIAQTLKTTPDRVLERIESLQKELKEAKSRRPAAGPVADPVKDLLAGVLATGAVWLVAGSVEGAGIPELRSFAPRILRELGEAGAVAIAGTGGGSVPFVIAAGPKAIAAGFDAGRIAREFGAAVKGGGGGRPEMAQGEGRDPSGLASALERVREAAKALAAPVDTPGTPS